MVRPAADMRCVPPRPSCRWTRRGILVLALLAEGLAPSAATACELGGVPEWPKYGILAQAMNDYVAGRFESAFERIRPGWHRRLTSDKKFRSVFPPYSGYPRGERLHQALLALARRACDCGDEELANAAAELLCPYDWDFVADACHKRYGVTLRRLTPSLPPPMTCLPQSMTGLPETGPYPPPTTPVLREDASPSERAVWKAEVLWTKGKLSAARSAARVILGNAQGEQDADRQRAWRIIGASSCSQRDRGTLTEALAHLDAAGANFVRYACRDAIAAEDPVFVATILKGDALDDWARIDQDAARPGVVACRAQFQIPGIISVVLDVGRGGDVLRVAVDWPPPEAPAADCVAAAIRAARLERLGCAQRNVRWSFHSEGGSMFPSRAEIRQVLKGVEPKARACMERDGRTGEALAAMIIGDDGKVRNVEIQGVLAGTPTADCIAAAVRAARFGPFRGGNMSVKWPFLGPTSPAAEPPRAPTAAPQVRRSVGRPAWAHWLTVSLGMDFSGRHFSFEEPNQPQFISRVAHALRLDVAAYPLALVLGDASLGKRAARGIGIGATVDYVFWPDSVPVGPQDSFLCGDKPVPCSFKTLEYRVEGGLRWRLAFAAGLDRPELLVAIEYGRHEFAIEKTLRAWQDPPRLRSVGPPDVGYSYVTFGLGGRVPIVRLLAVVAQLNFHALLDAGGIQSVEEYGSGGGWGLRCRVAFELRPWKGLRVVLAGFYEHFRLSFDHRETKDPATNTMLTTGDANDQYYGVSLGLGYVF